MGQISTKSLKNLCFFKVDFFFVNHICKWVGMYVYISENQLFHKLIQVYIGFFYYLIMFMNKKLEI